MSDLFEDSGVLRFEEFDITDCEHPELPEDAITFEDAEEVRHSIINSLGHIVEESEEAAVAIAHGMMKAVKQIQ